MEMLIRLFRKPAFRNPRECPHKSYIAKKTTFCWTFLPLTIWIYVHYFSRNYLWKSNPLSLEVLAVARKQF